MNSSKQSGITISGIFSKYGLPVGLILIAFRVVTFLADIDKEKWVVYLSWGVLLLAIIFCIYDAKKGQKNLISFKDAFNTGFFAAMLGILISSVYLFIHVQFVDTTFFEVMAQLQKAEVIKAGVSEELAEKSLQMASQFNTPLIYTAIDCIFNIFMSAVFSAVSAVIMKKD